MSQAFFTNGCYSNSFHDFAKHLAKKVGQGSLRYAKKKTKASACTQPEISMFKLLSHISNHHFIHPVEATPFNTINSNLNYMPLSDIEWIAHIWIEIIPNGQDYRHLHTKNN